GREDHGQRLRTGVRLRARRRSLHGVLHHQTHGTGDGFVDLPDDHRTPWRALVGGSQLAAWGSGVVYVARLQGEVSFLKTRRKTSSAAGLIFMKPTTRRKL